MVFGGTGGDGIGGFLVVCRKLDGVLSD